VTEHSSQGAAIAAPSAVAIREDDKLSQTSVFGYGVGDLGSNMAWGMGSTFLLFFYTDVFGITAAAAGTLLLVARIFDAVNDPVMGMITEHVETRWGKFRHYLLFGTPILGVLLVLTFTVPPLEGGAKLAYAYITYIALGTVFTAVNLPYGALATTMAQSAAERNRLSAARGAGAIVGGGVIVGMATPMLVEVLGGGDPATGFQATALIFAVICVVCLWFTFATSEEKFRAPEPSNISVGRLLAILKSNTPFLLLALSILLSSSASQTRLASVVYYATYCLKRPDLIAAIFLSGAIAMILGIVVGNRLAARLGKKDASLVGISVAVFGGFGMYLTNYEAIFVLLAWNIVVALGGGVMLGLLWSLISDTVEYGEWNSGVRAEGAVYSASSFVMKFSSALAGIIPAVVLSATGYIANQDQTPLATSGIDWMTTLIPSLLSLMAIVPLWYYPLTDDRFRSIVEDLEQRRV